MSATAAAVMDRNALLSALRGVQLPSFADIEAERGRRRAVWFPQHGEHCRYRDSFSLAAWKAEPCACPQTVAYYSEADILGYGGAAGGGKSDLIVGLGLTRHRRGIIFRREGTESRDLFTRAGEIALDVADAKINHTLHTVHLPSGDRQLEFSGIKNPDDWRKHRGRAKDFHAFDEATEFDEVMIRSLIGWNRTTIPDQRCRVVLTFNPPGIRHGQWLKTYFAPWLDPRHPNPAEDGELRWFTTIAGRDIECQGPEPIEVRGDVIGEPCAPLTTDHEGRCAHCGNEILYPLSRTFIKALLNDNEYLKHTKYRATLMGLPEPLRSQLLYGAFDAEEADDVWQVIPTKWVQAAQERWLDMERPEAPLSAIGADVSRGGKDRTAFAPRIGNWFDDVVAYPGIETPDGKSLILRLAEVVRRYRVVQHVIVGMDVVGVGASPQDVANEQGIHLVALSGAEGADDEYTDASGLLHFANKRAQWYWQLREALNPDKGENLALPPDRELLADLCAAHYDLSARGVVIEDKDGIRKRLGRSPDKGDAIVYAFAARPQSVQYQSISKRSSTEHLAHALPTSWKKKKGL